MKLTKHLLLLILAASVLLAGCAKEEGVKMINATPENVAIKGYDTIAFFTANAPAIGKPDLAHEWNGAKWYFANAENLARYKAAPEKYAPQFGGYCAWAVSHGYTADGDPEAWKIVDGRLYLNYNKQVKEKWEAEQMKLIEDGNRNWGEFQKKKPEHKG